METLLNPTLGLYVALVVLFACAVAVRSMARANAQMRSAARDYGVAGNSIRNDLERVTRVLNEAGGGLAQRASDLEHLRSRLASLKDPVAMGIAEAQLSYLRALAEAAGPHLDQRSRLWLVERPTASVLIKRHQVVMPPAQVSNDKACEHELRPCHAASDVLI